MMSLVSQTVMSPKPDTEAPERLESDGSQDPFAAMLASEPEENGRETQDASQGNPALTSADSPPPSAGSASEASAPTASVHAPATGTASPHVAPKSKSTGTSVSLPVVSLRAESLSLVPSFKEKVGLPRSGDPAGSARSQPTAMTDRYASNPQALTSPGSPSVGVDQLFSRMGARPSDSSTVATGQALTASTGQAVVAPLLGQSAQSASLPGPATPTATVTLPQPLGSPEWSQQLSDQILTVVRAEVGEAVINLAPEELGPVKVSLTLTDGEVRLQWIASVAETRQALEQALPRLREMMAQEGLQLMDSQVSSGSAHDNSQKFTGFAGSRSTSDQNVVDHGEGESEALTLRSDATRTGLLDLYA